MAYTCATCQGEHGSMMDAAACCGNDPQMQAESKAPNVQADTTDDDYDEAIEGEQDLGNR